MRNISELDDAAHRMMELLVAVGRRNSLRDPLAQLTETLELTPPQLHGVLWLGLDGPLSMGELARRVGVTEKTITGIVDRLEREGYAQRERDPADRRVVHVRLTPRGKKTADGIHDQAHESLGNFLSLLDAGDRTALLRIFEKLVGRMSVPPAAESP
ncbi:MarR family winged helix-turn-helix transcriptional regulator [Archangium violaceum]|uniref:MarR family transcriptional regulator n=1 Tax=Archangium violaceum Cb vi76 TaxID=1406225 RepID=A0A084SZJ2_9BACT|nr:MarR family transcriptional regulator [Archangium violaceum]KFA93877.1 MarR family transcriptional regulator [Archangium violaceum Cb vi76]